MIIITNIFDFGIFFCFFFSKTFSCILCWPFDSWVEEIVVYCNHTLLDNNAADCLIILHFPSTV